MRFIVLFFALILALSLKSKGQNLFGLLNSGRNVLSTGVNANPALNFNADYLYGIDHHKGLLKKYGFITHLNLPLFSQKGFNFDLRLGAGALLEFTSNFKALSGFSWGLSRTEDINGRFFHSGFKVDLLPGYMSRKFFFSPHFSLNYQPWINIRHSSYAIQAFQDIYPNRNGYFNSPQNGWFHQKNFTFQTGIGITYFQPAWHLNVTAGFQHQPNQWGLVSMPELGLMPFYGGLNLGYSLPDKK